jgi:hypothetical protein
MRASRFFLLSIILLIPIFSVGAQESSPTVEITSQAAGDAVRGIVPVSGNTAVEGFQSWELTFGYAGDKTGTWFFIAESDQPVDYDILTQWDTTTLTDGTYNLRLTVFFEGGRRTHFIVPDLRIRNYTSIETVTPTPTLTSTPFTVTPQPSLTPTITEPPTETPIPDTPTPLPTNPMEISTRHVTNSLMRGAAGALAAFLVIGLYATLKKVFRK